MPKKPSSPNIIRVASQDMLTSLAALFSVVLLISAVAFFFQIAQEQERGFLWQFFTLILGLLMVSVIVLAWRLPRQMHYIQQKWTRGIVGQACVVELEDTGRGHHRQRVLRYRFEYLGKVYEKTVYINPKWRPSRNTLDILIDPLEPDESLLTILYI
ncbi:hypothetical protein G4Y79_22000 [Phototrophicus methaneseepsis]|uniref:DUF3592 domain-containing protein n=1 Tax=Phototrophicus methaneseepsis TaxID=2710758 RepID=A0A7S8E8J6_9CHLR|nr:hypothetical protein [Phototrophicus methaneseepsis]QPC82325.1 hypothetical protein G4Y79_22000 [Phototrophicus methaneseepsis]